MLILELVEKGIFELCGSEMLVKEIDILLMLLNENALS